MMRSRCVALAALLCAVAIAWPHEGSGQSDALPYEFEGGFPTPETVARGYDDADLNRAVQAYRFFYPNVSVALLRRRLKIGVLSS
jgi:hypothetical protein